MKNNIPIIIRREYLERVSKKSFIITTILVPVFMVALMLVPMLLMYFHEPDTHTYAVVDNSGLIFNRLTNTNSVHFVNPDIPVDSLKANGDYSGILIIGRDVVENPTNIQLFNHGAGVVEVEQEITKQLKGAIEEIRLERLNIHNLNEILSMVEASPSISTYRLDSDEEISAMSSQVSYAIGIAISFTLYMFLVIYGQMVMTSIIEEKNNRVLEIVVSSVRPEQLMLGKILGIGLVALTQILIWLVIAMILIGVAMPALLPAEITESVAGFSNGTFDAATSNYDIDLIQTLSILGNNYYLIGLFAYLTLFLIGGFLLYASIFAAIGSAVDNIQDASQLQTIPMLPIIIAIICVTTIGTDPNSSIAVWLSMIPFTSPMIMMVRIPFGIPGWEIICSLILLYLSFLAMVWFAAKIYRVGIFMYGKKPTYKDLIKWARYK